MINTLNYKHQDLQDEKQKDQDTFNTDREKTININFKDFEKKQGAKASNASDAERSASTHQGLGIGLKDKQENTNTFE